MEEKGLIIQESKPLTVAEVKSQIQTIQQVMKGVMTGPTKENPSGVHYGLIAGCGNKPTLLKPGAEKIMATFRLAADPEINDLSNDDEIRYRVTVRLKTLTGLFVGAGIGECSTAEEKYKWRKAVCDEEFEETLDDKKRVKWAKSYGKVIQIQQVRTQPADLANTVLKMAKKRALVDAVLTATAASDIFDQDLEDLPEELIQANQNAGKPAPQKPQPKAQNNPPETTPEEATSGAEEYVSVTSALKALDGTVINIEGKVTKLREDTVGKDKNTITRYEVTDGKSKCVVSCWGNADAEVGDSCFFIGCKVSTYKETRQFLADQVCV